MRQLITASLLAALLNAAAPTANAQANASADVYLEAIGGPGGGGFVAHCGQGELLTGFDLRVADDVDSIAMICLSADGSQYHSSPARYGGHGGGPLQLVCPHDRPLLTGLYILSEGEKTEIVNSIHLYCVTSVGQQPSQEPAAAFDGPRIPSSSAFHSVPYAGEAQQACPVGFVGVGMNGRSGVWLDAVGLICGQPAPAKPPVALGRVKSTAKPALRYPVPTTASESNARAAEGAILTQSADHEPPICAYARSARARHSPAAASLESQCRAAGGEP